MDAIHALRTRRSVRAFSGQPVGRELLEQLIDCARLAPSGNNVQPWEFVVVTEREMLRRIGARAPHGHFIADAPACVVVLCRETKYYLEDGSAATQNVLVSAHALGLGTCWVAGDKKDYAPEIASWLGAPEGCRLVSLIAVGHSAEQPKPQKRTLESVLHWERFGG
jgi:nitroreductase